MRLNGRDLGHADRAGIPRDDRSRAARGRRTSLEIEVSNLMANRIAALDKAGVRWQKFYNVNFPARLPENRGAGRSVHRREMGAARSGLLGPVTLTRA